MADASSSNVFFEDRFTVDSVDKGGKKFDRVSRIEATSQNLKMHLVLDLANELFPLNAKETFTLALARNLVDEGDADPSAAGGAGEEDGDAGKRVKRELWRGGDQGLADDYEYVMYGKIYKYDDSVAGNDQTTAYISFGGLLLALRGAYRHLQGITVGQNVYLLMRK